MTAAGVAVGILVGLLLAAVLVLAIDPEWWRRPRPAGIVSGAGGARLAPPVAGMCGDEITVRESSLPNEACLWVTVKAARHRDWNEPYDEAAIELPVAAARELADQLAWLARNHIHGRYPR